MRRGRLINAKLGVDIDLKDIFHTFPLDEDGKPRYGSVLIGKRTPGSRPGINLPQEMGPEAVADTHASIDYNHEEHAYGITGFEEAPVYVVRGGEAESHLTSAGKRISLKDRDRVFLGDSRPLLFRVSRH